MPLRCSRQNGSGETGLCPRLRLRRRPHKRRKAHVAIHKPLVAALTHSDGRKNAHHKDRHRRQMARPALVHMNVWVVGGWSGRRADDVLGWLTCVATGWNLSDAANIAEECHGSRREKSDQREGDNGAAEPPLHTQTRRDVPVQGIAVAGTRLGSHFARGRRWALGGAIGVPARRGTQGKRPKPKVSSGHSGIGLDRLKPGRRGRATSSVRACTPDDCVLDEVLLEKMTGPSCQRQRTVGT